jgi:hypothetical protein
MFSAQNANHMRATALGHYEKALLHLCFAFPYHNATSAPTGKAQGVKRVPQTIKAKLLRLVLFS